MQITSIQIVIFDHHVATQKLEKSKVVPGVASLISAVDKSDHKCRELFQPDIPRDKHQGAHSCTLLGVNDSQH